MTRVTIQLDEPFLFFEPGSVIPLYKATGDLGDYATVVLCSFDGLLVLDLPDSEAGREMLQHIAKRDQAAAKKANDLAELERLYKL